MAAGVGGFCEVYRRGPVYLSRLALHDLFKPVNHRNALCMLTLILVAIPMAFLNELNAIAALSLVHGANFLSSFGRPQRD